VIHRGIELAENETFLDNGVTNNDGLKILLGIEYPDPADVPLVSNLLYQKVDSIIHIVRNIPQYLTHVSLIRRVRDLNYFHSMQQNYEGSRIEVIYSAYNYSLNLDVGYETLPDFPEIPEVSI
jgi:hypothetical protein